MIRRINMFAGPGAGKSTLAAWLFYQMKVDDFRVEHVQEYVKAWAHQERPPSGFDQIYIMGKQLHKEDIVLKDKSSPDKRIDIIVTECPIFLSVFYATDFKVPGANEMAGICHAFDEAYPPLNLFIDRGDKAYKPEGRFQKTVDEARRLDDFFKEKMAEHNVPFKTVNYGDLGGIKRIVYQETEAPPKIWWPEGLVLVDFWAEWCGPCKMMHKVMEELSEHRPDIHIVKINIDEEPKAKEAYDIRSIPALVLLKDGEELDRSQGFKNENKISNWIDEVIKQRT